MKRCSPLRNSLSRVTAALAFCVLIASAARCDEPSAELSAALTRAGDNRQELENALEQIPEDQLPGLVFLITNMPDTDLRALSSEFLLEHVQVAYRSWKQSKWHDQVSQDLFLNYILPYASIDERRDAWRKDFAKRLQPLVKSANSPSEAAAILNQKIFPLFDVKYSRRRPKANQSPYESIEAHVASCSGLSVLLIDACRAVGVPARFVGTPLWADGSGNHSWVEIWDGQWHFTGAAEPAGLQLDKAWFTGRASKALRDDPLRAIYATSFKRTPIHFPLVWNRRSRDVYALNVTDRYTKQKRQLPAGMVEVRFQVLAGPRGDRIAAKLKLTDSTGKPIASGTTKDERFDGNDHWTIALPLGQTCEIEATLPSGAKQQKTVDIQDEGQLVTLVVEGE